MFSPAAQQPTKRYRTIVADPPWGYRDKLGGPHERGAEGHYGTMTMPELYGLPVGNWAMSDSSLFLWTTNAFLEEAHRLARAWGFQPRTNITWVKGRIEGGKLILQIGLGHFFRNCTEHILFCVRGSVTVKARDMPTVFIAERHAHSEKPAAFYDMVQRVTHAPYLDVFARKQRFGWDTWGDEAFDFQEHGIWHERYTDASQ
jgi:N6-adenosine-specific RNA methylase IME4